VTGEHVLPVAPLDEANAAELLQARAAAVRPGFQITAANRAMVARLCTDLDALPLAIELAACRLRTLSLEQLTQRLEDRFALLNAGSRTARPHQRALRTTIDWSWELCAPAERLLWKRLSVFAGTFTLEAVEAVCLGDGIERSDVLDLLDRLVAQSLVEHSGHGHPARYRMLESIRHYGWEQLVDSGEAPRLCRAHLDYFTGFAERLRRDWLGPRQVEILARFRAEHGNLLAALAHEDKTNVAMSQLKRKLPGKPDASVEQGWHDDASGAQALADAAGRQATLALAAALVFHWVAGGFLSQGRRQLDRALSLAPEPTLVRARALMAAVYLAQTQYDLTTADRWLDEAERLAEQLDAPAISAQAQGHRGISALYAGRFGEVLPHLERAVAAYTALGDRFGEVTWRCALAIAQNVLGDPRAAANSERALADATAHGEQWARAHLVMVLGRSAWAGGKHAESQQLTLDALDMLEGFGDTASVAKMIEQLAWITAADRLHARAARLLGIANALRRASGTTVAGGDPRDEEYHRTCTTLVRDALGAAGYEQALADGEAIDGTTEAIAYALRRTDSTPDAANAQPADASPLTSREQQVAALVTQGMTNRQIAAELVVSPRTVDGHIDRILSKLGFSARAQIAAWWTAREVPSR
jgi:non-specific serine/threonine protein kinase